MDLHSKPQPVVGNCIKVCPQNRWRSLSLESLVGFKKQISLK